MHGTPIFWYKITQNVGEKKEIKSFVFLAFLFFRRIDKYSWLYKWKLFFFFSPSWRGLGGRGEGRGGEMCKDRKFVM